MFETTNSRTQGSMHFVETTKVGTNERIKYFHSNDVSQEFHNHYSIFKYTRFLHFSKMHA